MDKQFNLNKDELVAAVMAACSVGMSSMMAWYLISDLVDDAETTGEHMTVDEEANLGGIEEGMEASSEKTKAPPDSSLPSGGNPNKIHASHLILETMNSVTAHLGEIADALERSNKLSIDNLHNEIMKIQDFDDELLVEALEYVASDDKKAMTFLTLNERRRKNWLLKHLRGHTC